MPAALYMVDVLLPVEGQIIEGSLWFGTGGLSVFSALESCCLVFMSMDVYMHIRILADFLLTNSSVYLPILNILRIPLCMCGSLCPVQGSVVHLQVSFFIC